MAQLFWPFATSTVSEWPGTRPEGWADHVGTDFAVPQGTPLRATMSGTVDIIWNDGLGAWVIDIIAPDGTVARHGHLSHMAPKDGQWVNAGDYIGNTGGAIGTPGAGLSTGAHLHWEIRNNRGWGAWGWYDPRDLTIGSFDAPENTVPPLSAAKPKPPIHGMENDMIVFYEHALGLNKPGWLVLGYTPKPLFLFDQGEANAWQAHIGKKTLVVKQGKFLNYLRAANGTAAQIRRASQG